MAGLYGDRRQRQDCRDVFFFISYESFAAVVRSDSTIEKKMKMEQFVPFVVLVHVYSPAKIPDASSNFPHA